MKIKHYFNYWIADFGAFLRLLFLHLVSVHISPRFASFESVKSFVVGKLYVQRGKNAQAIVNLVMMTVMVLSVVLGPSLIVNDQQAQAVMSAGLGSKFAFAQEGTGTGGVLETSLDGGSVEIDPLTQVSEKPRAEVLEYTVEGGDTLAEIAKKFGVDVDSIMWLNKEVNEKKIKPGLVLKIPPVVGGGSPSKSRRNRLFDC